jgi:hypothetical protein
VSLSFFFERRQNAIKLSFKKKIQSKCEVRVLKKNLGHEGFGTSEGIKIGVLKRWKAIELSFEKLFLV